MVPVPISLLKLNDYWKSIESGYFAWRYGNSRGPDIAFVTWCSHWAYFVLPPFDCWLTETRLNFPVVVLNGLGESLITEREKGISYLKLSTPVCGRPKLSNPALESVSMLSRCGVCLAGLRFWLLLVFRTGASLIALFKYSRSICSLWILKCTFRNSTNVFYADKINLMA